MAQVTEKARLVAEHFLQLKHFTQNERRFIFLIAVNYEITDKEKKQFDTLIERHKFLLN